MSKLKSNDLLETVQGKLARKIRFTPLEPGEYSRLKKVSADGTWMVLGPGVTRIDAGAAMLYEIILDLVVYHDRPDDPAAAAKKIDLALSKLQAQIPANAAVRLSVTVLHQSDEDDRIRLQCRIDTVVPATD